VTHPAGEPSEARAVWVARWFLRTAALAFAGIGSAFLAVPETMGRFIGISLAGTTADNDVRAVYGGLQLACGALLVWASMEPRWLRAGLAAQLLLFSGLALGRFLSLGLVGPPEGLGLTLHAAELLGIALGGLCLRALPDGLER
jgi:hypothetical protein